MKQDIFNTEKHCQEHFLLLLFQGGNTIRRIYLHGVDNFQFSVLKHWNSPGREMLTLQAQSVVRDLDVRLQRTANKTSAQRVKNKMFSASRGY